MTKWLLISLLFVLTELRSQEELPAMISLDLTKQPDTIGYNLVQWVPGLLDEGIHNGKIPLWDSPKKEKKLSATFVKHLEEANKTRFSSQQFLFLHEYWSTNRKTTSFKIIGMSFIGINLADSSRFKYGYVDIEDITALLKSNLIPVNINGNYHITYWEALNNMDYPFILLQLGSHYFNDMEQSIAYKNDYFNPEKKITITKSSVETKFVSVHLSRDCVYKSSDAMRLFGFFNEHYGTNFQDFLKDGGERILNHLGPDIPMEIDGIEMGGYWRKEGENITIEPTYLLLFVDSYCMDTLYASKAQLWAAAQVSTLTAMQLKDEKSDLKVVQVNGTKVPEKDGRTLLELLRLHRWNKLSWPVIYKKD